MKSMYVLTCTTNPYRFEIIGEFSSTAAALEAIEGPYEAEADFDHPGCTDVISFARGDLYTIEPKGRR